ncbi:MAG: DNA-directed RNA polymerase subunit alpha [Kiritimatiellaeota bacterium]|nr:DNA-directed RNA polymerase subunit alpha [Kiritimatiellota bacterium]
MALISGFPIPKSIEMNEETATETYAEFTAAPFQTGFGHTIGNSLRRVLLSSLEGVAISAVRIDGVSNEFATIPNVIEEVAEIVLNLKQVKLTCEGDISSKMLEIVKSKAGTITAADIISDGTVEILNPDQIICTVDKKTDIRMELEISKGRGYVPAENNKKQDHPLGTIPIDSLFSPITRVKYDVGAARVGEKTEMDSLLMEIWTDARISPEDALEKAAKILQDHLRPFLGKQSDEDDMLSAISDEERKLYRLLIQHVDNMELSVRAQNCLNNADIKMIGELCQKTEVKMLKFRNFGRKSLDEIQARLDDMGLSLGMKMSDELTMAVNAEAEKIRNTDDRKEEDK